MIKVGYLKITGNICNGLGLQDFLLQHIKMISKLRNEYLSCDMVLLEKIYEIFQSLSFQHERKWQVPEEQHLLSLVEIVCFRHVCYNQDLFFNCQALGSVKKYAHIHGAANLTWSNFH